MEETWIWALLGGVLIGFSVSIMLWLNGRVTGISGITAGTFFGTQNERFWRLFFLLGLVVGGFILRGFPLPAFQTSYPLSAGWVVLAGVLVGFGTLLGNGCTSGHGVCGISRLSVRSILATLTFILTGVLTVSLVKGFGGMG